MNTILTFCRSGTGPAGRKAGQVPSLQFPAINPPRQPAIPDEGRSDDNMTQRGWKGGFRPIRRVSRSTP